MCGFGQSHLAGTAEIHRLPPSDLEVAIDRHRRLRINGKAIFPVWVWGTRLMRWLDGLNVTVVGVSGDYRSADFEEILPGAKRLDLACVCGAGGSAGKSDLADDRGRKLGAMKRQFERYRGFLLL